MKDDTGLKNKLKIGILLDSTYIPAWSYAMLEKINESLSAEIVLIVKNKLDTKAQKPLIRRIIDDRSSLLYYLFSKLERKLFKVKPDAFEIKDIKTFLTVDTIEVNPKKTKYRDIIEEEDLSNIKKYNIDIFIRMGFRILSGGILKTAKYGIWSYHHGDNKVNKGGPPGFWEVLENWPETGVILQILTEELDGGILIKKSTSLTDSLSPTRNKNNYYWKALSFLPLEIEKLHEQGEELYFERINELNIQPQFYSNRLFGLPSNLEMIKLTIKLTSKKVRYTINSLFYFHQWILLFKLNNSSSISTSFFQFKRILPPKDRFWADPHIVKKDNKYYIFIEELLYSTNKGHISLIIMDAKGKYTEPLKVLERDYHLSYPFLIEDNGDLFMIPETKENNTIELYKCKSFPDEWELEIVLVDNISAVDSTIIVKDEKYWLFANVVQNKGASALDELYIYYSEKLVDANWKSHPQNPVISDVKQSRPAGNFFVHNDNLYRPSQNCSKRYGYGMKINQVIQLNETTYKEKTVDAIVPNWDKNMIGTHTINHVDKLTIIDAMIRRKK